MTYFIYKLLNIHFRQLYFIRFDCFVNVLVQYDMVVYFTETPFSFLVEPICRFPSVMIPHKPICKVRCRYGYVQTDKCVTCECRPDPCLVRSFQPYNLSHSTLNRKNTSLDQTLTLHEKYIIFYSTRFSSCKMHLKIGFKH